MSLRFQLIRHTSIRRKPLSIEIYLDPGLGLA